MWYFISQAQKITNSRSFYLIFNRLGKIQDDNHVWWRHRAPAGPLSIKYTSSCLKDQKLSTQGKIVSKYCNVSKTLGRSSINPSIMYHGGGTTLRKNEGECFIMGSKAERQMKRQGAVGCALSSFTRCLEPVLKHEARVFLYVVLNGTCVTCFLWYCIVFMSGVNQ